MFFESAGSRKLKHTAQGVMVIVTAPAADVEFDGAYNIHHAEAQYT